VVHPWLVMETGPVVIYHAAGQEALAKEVALYARDAYEELVYLFDFRPDGHIALRLHPTVYSYAHQPRWNPLSALSAPANLAEVVRMTDKPAFIGQVRAQVAALFLMKLYYGTGVRFQNRVLLYLPDWFLWGFAFFWGEGWQVEDRAMLVNYTPNALEAMWNRSASPWPLYRPLYKSIWYWLYRTYGQKKIIDLLYMVRLTRQVSEALYLTLNLSEEDLTEKWLAFVGELRQASQQKVSSIFGLLPVWGAAVSQRGEIAHAQSVGGEVRYYVENSEGGTQRLPGSFRWPLLRDYYEPYLPMSYSRKGQLAWVSYRPLGAVVWIWSGDTEKAAVSHELSLKGISSLAWRDEESLLLTGWEEGEAQIYELEVRNGRLRKLTKEAGDKAEVFWTGREIYYLWQADSLGKASYRQVWGPYGWARMPATWQQMSPLGGWGGGWLQRNDTILVARDAAGAWQPWVVLAETAYVSQWQPGHFRRWIGATSDKAYYLYHANGHLRIGAVAWADLLQGGVMYPDVYAAERIQMLLQRQARYPSLPTALGVSPPAAKDSLSEDTARKGRGPFYYFDEEVERPRRRSRRTPFTAAPRGKYFYPESVAVRSTGRAPLQGLWSGIAIRPTLHPLMRLGIDMRLSVETFSGRYRFWGGWRPYVDLRSSELWLGWERRVGAWQPTFTVHRQMHFFSQSRYGQGLRLQSWWAEGGLRYTWRPDWRVSILGLGFYGRRYDMVLRDFLDYSGEALWWGGRAEVLHERLYRREAFLWAGRRLVLRAEGFPRQGQWAFGLLSAQAAWHRPLASWVILDVDGQAAFGSASNYRYFLLGGIPDWINYTVQNRSQLPLLGPIGGYYLNSFVFLPGHSYHTRRGRHLLVSSVALRLPLLALQPPAVLPTRIIYGLEWKVAAYAATTWTRGNPFSQKNPIDAEFIYRPPLVISVQTLRSPFLLSVGSSLTFRVMGMPVEAGLYWPVEDERIGRPQFLLGFRSGLP